MADPTPLRPWCRLDAATYSDASLIRAGFEACAVFPAILARAKLMGRLGGRLKPEDLDPIILARFMNGDGSNVTFVTAGVNALRREGKINDDGFGGIEIPNWSRYQGDPSNVTRQARFRENKRATQGSAGDASNVMSRYPVTVTPTGRDVTGRDVEESPLPPPHVTPSNVTANGHGTAGGSASPSSRNGHGEPQSVADIMAGMNGSPLEPAEIAGVLAACAAIVGRKDVAPETRAKAREVRDGFKSGQMPNPKGIRGFVQGTVYALDFARIAYLAERRDAR